MPLHPLRRVDRALEDFPVALGGQGRYPRLDADDDVPMLTAHARRLMDVRPSDVFQPGIPYDHPHGGDVEQREDARPGPVYHVLPERGETCWPLTIPRQRP